MQVIAHRGASGLEPENTLRSFKKAEQIGVDMIELDVRRSKDGELVVLHDPDLLRLFGDPRRIKDLELAEIKRVSRMTDREIPTLDEVLSAVHTGLNIHVKVHGIEEQVLAKIKNFPHKVLISCTFPGVLKKFRTLDGKIPLALIIGKGELHLLPFINLYTKNLDLYSIHPKYVLVNPISISLMRWSGRKINVWTVNTKKEYLRMKKMRVTGVITNYPDRMKNYENE